MPPYAYSEGSTKCCCFPIKVGAIIVGVLEFLGLLVLLLAVAAFYKRGGSGYATSIDARGYNMDLGLGPTGQYYRSVLEKAVEVGNVKASLICTIIGFLVGTATVIALLFGVVKEKAKLVFLHLIAQIIAIFGYLIAIIVYALYAADVIQATEKQLIPDSYTLEVNRERVDDATPDPGKLHDFQETVKGMRFSLAITFSVFFGIAIIIQLSFIYVVHKCFKFLAHKEKQ